MQTHHSRRREKASPTCRTKERERMDNLRTTIPNRKQRRTMGREIKTMGNGVSSITTPGITPLNVSQRIHWWLR
jgi:hypothetical protein